MGKPRTPTNVLRLRGSDKVNPGRLENRKDEPTPNSEIGDPPETLPEGAKACWLEIVDLAHAGTLSRADRLLLEHGARMLAELRAADWRVPVQLLMRWEVFLGKLGMTPADRSKVSVTKPVKHADPLDEFSAAG